MERALYILIKEFGDDGKEVMMHRAKMLTFQVRTYGEENYDCSIELFNFSQHIVFYRALFH